MEDKIINTKRAPGPKHWFLGANGALSFYTDIAGYLNKKKSKYGDFVLLKATGHHMYLISNLQYIEHILVKNYKNFTKGTGYQRARVILGNGIVTSDGEFHDTQRKMINPSFHKNRIAEYHNIVAKATKDLICDWEKRIDQNPTFEIHDEMTKLFINIILNSLFSSDTTSELFETGYIYTRLFQEANPFVFQNPEKVLKLPIPSIKYFVGIKNKMEGFLWDIIKKRRNEDADEKHDILNMLMTSEDANGNKMNDDALFDELRTLFSAANDTSAKVMTWAIYSLSKDHSIRDKAEKQIAVVLENRFPGYEDFEKLTYIKMILNETLRMYPPVWMLPRTPINDFYLDDYLIKKDSSIFISPYLIQRDERYFNNPDIFNPERFTEEEKKNRPRFAYFPFGAGPRICIGEAFAMFHMVIVLSVFCQKYRFKLAPGQRVKISSSLTLKPKYGMNMIVERR